MKLVLTSLTALLLAISHSSLAGHHETHSAEIKTADVPTGIRTNTIETSAEIIAIDYSSREIQLLTPLGQKVTVTAGPAIKRLEALDVGDLIEATFVSSLVTELRAPTEAEAAAPYVEILDTMTTASGEKPAGAAARMIRSVCIIEGLNRAARTVMISDARGKHHVVHDVKPESFEALSLGQQAIVTYSQAIALTLEKKSAAQD